MLKDLFDKNTLMGVGLIVLMVAGYFYYSKKKFENLAKEQKIQEELKKKEATTKIVNKSLRIDSVGNVPALVQDSIVPKGEMLTLSNNLISVDINTVGAKINNAELRKHTTFKNEPVKLLSNEGTTIDYSLPTANGMINTKSLAFQVLSKTNEKIELQSASGVKVTYTLSSNSYMLKQVWTIPNMPQKAQAHLFMETSMNNQEANLARERQYSTINYLKQNDDVLSGLSNTKNESLDEKTPLSWISFGQQFFNASVIPTNGFSEAKMSTQFDESDQNYVKRYTTSAVLAPQDGQIALDYYIGPSDYKLLKKEDKKLELIVPLSANVLILRWIKIFNIYLIIPMFDFLSKFISNYGIIILIMTVFIKIITAPLSYKTYKSGVAMKILKPQLDKLREKFGDDQQKLSQEQMKLYGEFGVSPFGGCLPMLLQMPILFAMFYFFPSSIELRHEPFLWAKDLSTFDSILTLPFSFYNHVSLFALLTSVTQIGMSVYSQRLQPSSPQADQMKMMTYLMPVIFLFMFNSFPAALTYYYFLQNLLSMIQQWIFTTFIIKEDKVRAEMELAKTTPKKQSGFQKKMAEMMEQAEQQRKMQQNQNKK